MTPLKGVRLGHGDRRKRHDFLLYHLPTSVFATQPSNVALAENTINSLPMVKAGLFDVSYLQLGEWTQMTRMLREHQQSIPAWYPN